MRLPLTRRGMIGAVLTLIAGNAASTHSATAPADGGKKNALIKHPMERGYATGPFGQVHYQAAHAGKPVVLIHQAPMSSRQFESVYPIFIERGYRPIGIDCPGFGMSDVTDFVPRVEDWARVVPAVLDHLGIAQADIVGHHTGALVATEVERQFRPRVRKLVLGSALPLTDEERRKFMDGVEKHEINFVYQSDGSHLQNSFMTRYRMYGDSPAPDPRLITRYTVEKFMGLGPFWHGHHAAFTYDHAAALPHIRRETLILTNTGDQIYEHSKAAHRLRPDFAYAELSGGGVDIVDQQPHQWVEVIDRFLSA